MKLFSSLFFIVFFISSSVLADDNTLTIGTKHTISSKILDEDREYWVSLPEGYDPETKYPVVYMLDGSDHFYYTAGVLRKMARRGSSIPEMILVAIFNTDRSRDLTPTNSTIDTAGRSVESWKTTGGADNFLSFLIDELAPEIESTYKTQPYRMLIGHSFGGLFALHASLVKPEFFTSMIVIDPSIWWDDRVLIKNLKEKLGTPPTAPITIFMSAANNPDDPADTEKGLMIKPQREYTALLSNWTSDTFKNTLKYYEMENHGTVPLPSLYDGLRYIFDGFAVDLMDVLQRPELLVEHYKGLTEKLGFELKPDESTMLFIGGYLLMDKENDKAIRTFEMAVRTYPQSVSAHIALGDGYSATGNPEKAKDSYETALKLDPENKDAKEKLSGLNN